MYKEGIEKAADRLRKMRLAVDAMKTAKDWQSMADAWQSFLMAAGSFYSVIEQASKANNQAREWFGRRKHVRKTDPLLRYIHHARNTKDHGCQRVFEPASTKLSLLTKGASVRLRSDGRNWIAENIQGDVKFANNTIKLVRVEDERFGDHFDPPTHHLNQQLQNASALHVAELALTYLEAMLSEAMAMAR
ncbi:MAG: hypothetical protein JNM89_08710 [Hyphomicrobiaceae bacterium]|nr:hypothetical protein [Hyphomicrobiaceae bacterium]